MNNNLITIITVCYNSVDTIEKTIRSVVGQTYMPIEYIVIDGGSTDGTVDIIKKYSNKISYWVSEPDKGIYDAMNKGISLATGEWVHFRNSGDFFLRKNTLEMFFAEPVADNVAVVHGNCYYFDENGWYEQTPPSLHVSYKKQIPVLHPATFVRTSLQKETPFDLQYCSSSDYDFFFKCCEKGVRFEYRPIAIVGFARGGFSSNWERAFWEDRKIQGFVSCYGKFSSYIKYYRIKLNNYCSSLKNKHSVLRKFSLHRKKQQIYAKKNNPLPVPSDF